MIVYLQTVTLLPPLSIISGRAIKRLLQMKRDTVHYLITPSLDMKAALKGSHTMKLDHFCGFKIDSVTLQLRHEEGDTDL